MKICADDFFLYDFCPGRQTCKDKDKKILVILSWWFVLTTGLYRGSFNDRSRKRNNMARQDLNVFFSGVVSKCVKDPSTYRKKPYFLRQTSVNLWTFLLLLIDMFYCWGEESSCSRALFLEAFFSWIFWHSCNSNEPFFFLGGGVGWDLFLEVMKDHFLPSWCYVFSSLQWAHLKKKTEVRCLFQGILIFRWSFHFYISDISQVWLGCY